LTRPAVSLKRYPNGIDTIYFFQKDAEDKVPDWVRPRTNFSEHNRTRSLNHLANDRAPLLILRTLRPSTKIRG